MTYIWVTSLQMLWLISSLIPLWLETIDDFDPLKFSETCFYGSAYSFISVLYALEKNVYISLLQVKCLTGQVGSSYLHFLYSYWFRLLSPSLIEICIQNLPFKMWICLFSSFNLDNFTLHILSIYCIHRNLELLNLLGDFNSQCEMSCFISGSTSCRVVIHILPFFYLRIFDSWFLK